ncbi:MAG: class I SAM-dependent methyltransferase [Acidimicrobiales bacterium]
MHVTHRTSCRTCGSTALSPVIDLGEQHIQGAFMKEGTGPPPARRLSLELVRCDPMRDERACGLLQLSATVPPEILYSTYWYRSGTNRTMRDHLAGVAAEAAELVGRADARVLDIGCNDGTLLDAYPPGFERYGVDPSDVAEGFEGVTVVRDRFPSESVTQLAEKRPFDAITSIAMFYDLEDPVAFVAALKRCLAPDGVWIFEMSYMPSMLEMVSYDTICHEHLEYYSLAVVEYVLARAGMRVFRAGLNGINGGSLRAYATHAESQRFADRGFRAGVAELRQREFDLALDTAKPYADFGYRVESHRAELTRLVRDLKRAHSTIHVYGASTKGNTILQYCGIDASHIDYAADRSPAKHGARTIGTEIPIISEEESRAMRPDHYLVLPWHFRDEFLAREADALRAGTRMIFPLPTVEVVGPVAAGR